MEVDLSRYLLHREPSFIIIGAQKCGTTSLYRYLTAHPNIQPATYKELNFFGDLYEKGLDFYRSFFPPVKLFQGMMTGEASPSYLFHPRVPERVFRSFPDIKILLLLRDPVDRTYSHYQHNRRKGRIHYSFEEALSQEKQRFRKRKKPLLKDERYQSITYRRFSYLARGRYIEQVPLWMTLFPKDQFCIIKSEAFFMTPDNTLEQVFAFLGLPHHQFSEYPTFNANTYPPMRPATRRMLTEYFRPYNQQLYEYLKIDFCWEEESMCPQS